MKNIKRLSVGLLAMTLMACGGGDDGPGAVTLKSESDVVREVLNLGNLVQPVQPAAKSGQAGGSKLMQRLAGSNRAKAKSKAAEVIPCSTGSYTYEFFSQVNRELPLFGTSTTMDYDQYESRNCKYTEGTYSETYNGWEEYGYNYAYSNGTDYWYDAYGRGSAAYVEKYQDTGESGTFKSLGRSEGRETATVYESRDALEIDFDFSFEGERFRFSFDLGESGNPLILVEDYAAETVSIDGPLAYTVPGCRGGRIEYTTVQPITFGSDQLGSFVNGGQVVMEAGSAEVTVTAQLNGDLDYQFTGGISGTVTRAELDSAADECVFLF